MKNSTNELFILSRGQPPILIQGSTSLCEEVDRRDFSRQSSEVDPGSSALTGEKKNGSTAAVRRPWVDFKNNLGDAPPASAAAAGDQTPRVFTVVSIAAHSTTGMESFCVRVLPARTPAGTPPGLSIANTG